MNCLLLISRPEFVALLISGAIGFFLLGMLFDN
jgi:hypothetical protein